MANDPEQAQSADLDEKLHQIIDRMLEPFGKSSVRLQAGNALSFNPKSVPRAALDISQPTQHRTRAEFQCEYEAVSEAAELANKLFRTLVETGDDEARKPVLRQMAEILTAKFQKNSPRTGFGDSHTLVQKIIADVGGFSSTMIALLDLRHALLDRLQELEIQHDKFWNLPHRAPDYYARAIALRLAKVYAYETEQLPTYGTAAVTGEPSTHFSRALKETFALLEISGNHRTYAEWAVSRLTEEDTKPYANSLLASLMDNGTTRPSEEELLRQLASESREKGSEG